MEIEEVTLESTTSLSLMYRSNLPPETPRAFDFFAISVSPSGINVLPRLSFLDIAKLTASGSDAQVLCDRTWARDK